MINGEKEYQLTKGEYAWLSEGRVIYEQNLDDLSRVDIFLIQSISNDDIVYLFVDDELPVDEWETSTDERGEQDVPDKPEGWTDVSE